MDLTPLIELSTPLFIAASLLSFRREWPNNIRSAILSRCHLLGRSFEEDKLIELIKQSLNGIDNPVLPENWPSQNQMTHAKRFAQIWYNNGIRIVTGNPGHCSVSNHIRTSVIFFATGNLDILKNHKIALINSRKPRLLSPGNRWVQATKGLFRDSDHDDAVWISSLGNYPYELFCALCADRERPLIVVMDDLLPEMGNDEKRASFYQKYGALFPAEKTLLLSPFTPGRTPSSRERQQLRDTCVVGLADQLLVAEVRSGGNMERLAIQAGKNGRPVTAFRPNAFDRETAGNGKILASGARSWKLPPGSAVVLSESQSHPWPEQNIKDTPDLDGQFLIHFTRSCPGPWPGQGMFEYYRSVANEEPGADHTAFDTLVRMIEEQKIRAQSRMVRGKIGVISFTAAGLLSARYLISWRQGLVRWTFEPYGLAIHRRVLLTRGVRPVIYGDERVWKRLPRRERFRFQKYSSQGQTWLKEKEWRIAGDLDLTDIKKENIRVIVRDPSERDVVAERWGLAVICLQDPR